MQLGAKAQRLIEAAFFIRRMKKIFRNETWGKTVMSETGVKIHAGKVRSNWWLSVKNF